MIGGNTPLSIATHRAGILTLNPSRNPIRNAETLTPALYRNILRGRNPLRNREPTPGTHALEPEPSPQA